MKEKILEEIYHYCETCKSHEFCPEEDYVLFRIEQIILDKEKQNGSNQS